MSPIDGKALIAAARAARPSSDGDEEALAAFRSSYLETAEPVGTVPVPGTLKGVAKTVVQKLTGKKPEVLLDKLAERLAFERTGTRLYDALLGKCGVLGDEASSLPLEDLRDFRDEEAQHFALVWEVLRELGADPTAQTPGADLSGVAAMGLVQLITDPRTSIAQSIQAIHIAELADHDGWKMLITLTEELGMDDIAGRFRKAWAEEDRHLATIRDLMAKSMMSEAGVA
jgi:rubrerythrin